jgi:hypothetical protein
MVKVVEEQLERFNMADPKRTEDEAVQYMVEHMGYRPESARREVRLVRRNPKSDRIVTMPDGTRKMYTI